MRRRLEEDDHATRFCNHFRLRAWQKEPRLAAGSAALMGRVPMTTIEKMLCVVENLPPDATVEEAMEPLLFLAKVERGLEQAHSIRIPRPVFKLATQRDIANGAEG